MGYRDKMNKCFLSKCFFTHLVKTMNQKIFDFSTYWHGGSCLVGRGAIDMIFTAIDFQ